MGGLSIVDQLTADHISIPTAYLFGRAFNVISIMSKNEVKCVRKISLRVNQKLLNYNYAFLETNCVSDITLLVKCNS